MPKKTKKIEATFDTKPFTRPQLKYRFFCPACTGRALYAPEIHAFTSVTCQNCGTLVAYDANNWFEVTDPEELNKINS